MSVPTTNAKGLYSTKWINSSYTGPIFTFRRSTDNVTQDFYVSGSSIGTSPGALGTSLQSWLGAATAYVTKWWDQSLLGNHATQTTNANQPTFDVSNNCIQFTSSSFQRLSLPDNTVPSGNLNYTVVVKHLDFTPLSNGFIGSGTPGNGGTNTFGYNNGYINYWWASDQTSGTYTANSTVSWTYDGANRRFYLNGTLTNTMSSGGRNSGTTNNFIGFGDTTNMNYFDGKLSFIYVYNAVLSDSSRALAESNTGLGNSVSTVYPCFLQGSKILRFNPETYQDDYIPVEKLRKGDLIPTAESGYQPIHSIGYKTIPNPKTDINPSNRLYKFSNKSCQTVFEPLYITGEHCTLHRKISKEKLELIKTHMGDVYITEEFYRMPALLDDRAEPYDREDTPVTIWHFALENDNVAHNYGVYANGLLVESCAIESLMEKSGMNFIE